MPSTTELEKNRKRFFFSICTWIAVIVFSAFIVINYMENDSLEMTIDLLVILVMVASHITIRKLNADTIVYHVCHFLICLILFYSVSIGAGENTALFWVFFMPLLFFFFFGKKRGLVWAVLFFICICFIMLFPAAFNGHAYGLKAVLRFFITLFTITVLSYGLESARYTFSKLIDDNNQVLLKEKQQLAQALKQIKTLNGLIPICSNCKKIRDDKGYWEQVETYVEKHSEAEFSHSVCPDCVKILYPGMKIRLKDKTV